MSEAMRATGFGFSFQEKKDSFFSRIAQAAREGLEKYVDYAIKFNPIGKLAETIGEHIASHSQMDVAGKNISMTSPDPESDFGKGSVNARLISEFNPLETAAAMEALAKAEGLRLKSNNSSEQIPEVWSEAAEAIRNRSNADMLRRFLKAKGIPDNNEELENARKRNRPVDLKRYVSTQMAKWRQSNHGFNLIGEFGQFAYMTREKMKKSHSQNILVGQDMANKWHFAQYDTFSTNYLTSSEAKMVSNRDNRHIDTCSWPADRIDEICGPLVKGVLCGVTKELDASSVGEVKKEIVLETAKARQDIDFSCFLGDDTTQETNAVQEEAQEYQMRM